MEVDIIGGGIGGLATAISLQQLGVNVNVFEQADSIKPVGAGIILANNAMQIFEKLGLRKKIEDAGNEVSSMCISKANLDPLSDFSMSYFEEKHGVKSVAIHRAVLQDILISALKSSTLDLGHRIKEIKSEKSPYQLIFENGRKVESSILIGADGLNSTLRKHFFPESSIRDAKQLCWRGVVDYKLPSRFHHKVNEAWGGSERFGFARIAKGSVYWFAVMPFQKSEEELININLNSYFKSFDPMVQDIIASTPISQINTNKILDVKASKNWYKDKICLIGDAAHAATPNMGQGACQAIEDAYVLSQCLNSYSIKQAFREFQRLRIKKVQNVVKTSWMIGKMAHISNPLLMGLRNQILRLTPESVQRKQLESTFEIPNL